MIVQMLELFLSFLPFLQDNDYRGIIHCHSYLSHDSKGTNEEILAAARRAGVDFICMTDHPAPDSLSRALEGRHGDVLVIKGAEHPKLMALGLREPLKGENTQAKIDEALNQGALAFLCHIEQIPRLDSYSRFTGIELYNVHADVEDEDKLKLFAAAVKWLKDDPDHSFLAFFNPPSRNLWHWDRLLLKRKTPAVAGNDAHQNVRLGKIQLDPYERSFRFVSTHIFAGELQPKAVLEALAAGRSYIAFDLLGDPKGFRFMIGKHTMGDEFVFEKCEINVTLPREAVIRLLRNGRQIAMDYGAVLKRPLKTPGVYRVEVYTLYNDRPYPWIYSNPIYVRSAGGGT